MPQHWICKVNGRRASGTRWVRDFFAKAEAEHELEWGNAKRARNDDDRRRYDRLAPGDIVFAYQSDQKSLMGVLEVTRIATDAEPVTYYGRTIVQFREPVPILQMKRIDKELECVLAFQQGMGRGTLHAAADFEVKSLVHACVRNNGGRYFGISPDEIRRGIHHGGAAEAPLAGPTDDELDGKYGAQGESEEHRALKRFVHANPDVVKSPSSWRKHLEYALPSGNRADVAFISRDKSMATVVAVANEGDDETRAALTQALEHRAEMCDVLGVDAKSPMVRAFLVAHSISRDVSSLGRKSGVQCIKLNRARVG